METGIDGMLANATEPITGIAPLLFGTMKDSVPKAAVRRFQILHDMVSVIPTAGAIEQSGLGTLGRTSGFRYFRRHFN